MAGGARKTTRQPEAPADPAASEIPTIAQAGRAKAT